MLKADGTYRSVLDLRAINNLVIPIAPIVPDVPLLITSIPHSANRVFFCHRFKQRLFSVPVDEETQLLMAFCFEKTQYTWARLPQGYVDSPAVYSMRLYTENGPVLQYVDELLLCSLSLAAS